MENPNLSLESYLSFWYNTSIPIPLRVTKALKCQSGSRDDHPHRKTKIADCWIQWKGIERLFDLIGQKVCRKFKALIPALCVSWPWNNRKRKVLQLPKISKTKPWTDCESCFQEKQREKRVTSSDYKICLKTERCQSQVSHPWSLGLSKQLSCFKYWVHVKSAVLQIRVSFSGWSSFQSTLFLFKLISFTW